MVRYTAAQDAGTAIHPSYVEGQMQGGSVQGIGWALNEEYIYNDDGLLENPSFLDYRVPVASDLPMIETIIVEVPNPLHPYGVRGVGETGIVPPLPAIANAIFDATGCRLTATPMTPIRISRGHQRARVTATVYFSSLYRRFTDGVAEVEADGATVAAVIANLDSQFPGIGAHLSEGTAVVINGVLIAHAEYEPVPDGAELHFVHQPSGG